MICINIEIDNPQPSPNMQTECWCNFYQITNKITGKCYIGQTIRDPCVRFAEHIHASTQDDPGCRAIALAIKSYGVENFTFEVILREYGTDHDQMECMLIEECNSMAPNGYNLYPGGKNTYKGHTGSARDKISEAQRKHFDENHNLPRYVWFVPKGEHGEGYSVQLPGINFMQFSSVYFTMEEKYDFAIRYLIGEQDRKNIREEYMRLKKERKHQNILKEVVIGNEIYHLPVHFMWCPGENYFLVRKAGKKAKQFGDSRITVRQNYEKALAYYNS